MPNVYKKFRAFFPSPKKYYGEISSISGDDLVITLLGGGTMTFTNPAAAAQFQEEDTVWITNDRGSWVFESAPGMSAYTIEV